jgi:hypothetical protein
MPALPNPKKQDPKKSAADIAFSEFLAAERQQESGGRYGVVNAIGAAGAYQIMGYHIHDWSKAALGHPISEHEFLTHPAEQDAIAAYELRPVYDKHGPRGAAAWWYSGSWKLADDYRPQKNGPSIGAYVDQVMARIGKAGRVNTSGGGGASATPADDVSGSAVHTAGLQQAGYEAVINLGPFGVPTNPLKLPGWLAGKLAGAAGGAVKGAEQGMWDVAGPIVLGGLGAAGGLALVVLGLYVAVKPAVEKETQTVIQTAGAVAPLTAVA